MCDEVGCARKPESPCCASPRRTGRGLTAVKVAYQNPVLKWSTQNHASRIKKADIRSCLWPGDCLTNLHLPGFWFWLTWCQAGACAQGVAEVACLLVGVLRKSATPPRPPRRPMAKRRSATCLAKSALSRRTNRRSQTEIPAFRRRAKFFESVLQWWPNCHTRAGDWRGLQLTAQALW